MAIINNKDEYKKRVIDSTIETYLTVSGGICIEGPKWCGKTWASANHGKSEFLVGSPDNDFLNRKLASLQPTAVLQGDTPRVIDEWQEVPALWDAARAEIDRRHKKGQFILTGSSTPRTKGVMHSGAGRIVRLRMDTMSLYETGDSSGLVSLEELCSGNLDTVLTGDVLLEDLATYIVRGGWPDNISVSHEKTHLMPRSYMRTIVDNDLPRLDEDAEYDRRRALLVLRSLARNESTTVSDSTILSDITGNGRDVMSRNTLTRYLEALSRLFLFSNQLPYSPEIRSSLRIKVAEKRHFSDPAMAAALLNLTREKLMKDLNTFDLLFEALVEHDLRVYASSFDGTLYHYQDYRNNEIDAVIELPDGEWCAFEIKLGAGKIDEGAASLLKVSSDIEKNGGKPPKTKCVICGLANAAYIRPDGVFVVPLTALRN